MNFDSLLEHPAEWDTFEVNETNYTALFRYITEAAKLIPDPEGEQLLRKLIPHTLRFQPIDSVRLALRLHDMPLIRVALDACKDEYQKKQCVLLLRGEVRLEELPPDLADLANNVKLADYFAMMAKSLDVTETKTPEDVYKSHLVDKDAHAVTAPPGAARVDSAKENLAASFVSAFVNCAHGQDTLIDQQGINWVYRNKDSGQTSATAALGAIHLWDVNGGSNLVDKYLYATGPIKAGGLLALGALSCNIRDEADPAFGLLVDYLADADNGVRMAALLGLGLAYCGTGREDLLVLADPLTSDAPIEVAAISALACGLVFVGTANVQVAQALMQAVMEREADIMAHPLGRFLALGLGLLYMGRQECEAALEACSTLKAPTSEYAALVVEMCAYAGTGNMLKIQKFLGVCTEENKQIATLGLALVGMGEPLVAQMLLRHFDRIIQYGEMPTRRLVPLAIGLLFASDPRVELMGTLSRLSHDQDPEVCMGALMGLGLVGAGTNNGTIAKLLRDLSAYHGKDPNILFMVRIAQGLTHMGKGILSLSPAHSDGLLISRPALAGLVATAMACTNFNDLIQGNYHYLLYTLLPAVHPRVLMTLDADTMQPVGVQCRVGKAVDVAGQVWLLAPLRGGWGMGGYPAALVVVLPWWWCCLGAGAALVVVLPWCCLGAAAALVVVLPWCWCCLGAALVLVLPWWWCCLGAALVLPWWWCCLGAALVLLLPWCCLGAAAALVLPWCCCCLGAALVLLLPWCCCCLGAALVLLLPWWWCCLGGGAALVVVLPWCCLGAAAAPLFTHAPFLDPTSSARTRKRAQPGTPNTITGFQTMTTPVLLSPGQRAELVAPEYKRFTTVNEGIVLLKKKAQWEIELEEMQERAAAPKPSPKTTGTTPPQPPLPPPAPPPRPASPHPPSNEWLGRRDLT
ncbi:putative 26S proteasome non-ATPase regulatory subunit 2 [Paratrimastix pyriformis]|uniref:26S proteasome non-ATPase regulatory subunit 2 n=1 Tax=Paratrimastix pyriformis TaxID=342808 RepID=A0ABQ8UAF9_9EUKA|nr:putative 26S proteasome non-ATPase regulatory subunit 2 [Paratrimastix pyriformis]